MFTYVSGEFRAYTPKIPYTISNFDLAILLNINYVWPLD
jgi:hypothetical protein